MKSRIVRKTPVDDISILDKWRNTHKENLKKGMSYRASYKMIANQYGCSWGAPYYWLNEKFRFLQLQSKKNSNIRYSEQDKDEIDKKRVGSRLYTDIRNNINIYVKEVFINHDRPRSLDEIVLCIERLTGIKMRSKTLIQAIYRYEIKHNIKLLSKVDDNGYAIYRLE